MVFNDGKKDYISYQKREVSIQAKERASRNGSTVVIVIVIFMT